MGYVNKTSKAIQAWVFNDLAVDMEGAKINVQGFRYDQTDDKPQFDIVMYRNISALSSMAIPGIVNYFDAKECPADNCFVRLQITAAKLGVF